MTWFHPIFSNMLKAQLSSFVNGSLMVFWPLAGPQAPGAMDHFTGLALHTGPGLNWDAWPLGLADDWVPVL